MASETPTRAAVFTGAVVTLVALWLADRAGLASLFDAPPPDQEPEGESWFDDLDLGGFFE